jgi:hypothetical protein
MTETRLEPPAPTAVRQLVDAVVAFCEDPGPDNLERYLAASRALEDSRLQRAGSDSPAQSPEKEHAR